MVITLPLMKMEKGFLFSKILYNSSFVNHKYYIHMKKFDDLKTGTKFSISLCAVTSVMLVVFGLYTLSNQKKSIIENSDLRLFEQVTDLGNMLDLQIRDNQKKVISYGEFASEILNNSGEISINKTKTHSVNVKNQENGNTESVELPEMLLNKQPLYKNYEFVDRIGSMTNGTNTIFQKFKDGYLRISTNLTDSTGAKMVNTFIPLSSKVAESLNRGETYKGKAIILGEQYLTYYKPIKIGSDVVGAYYFGLLEKDLSLLNTIFKEKKFYTNGYPYVVDKAGNFIIHPTSMGKNISNEGFFKEMVGMGTGKTQYLWEGKSKYQHFKYYPENEFYVATTIYEADLLEEISAVRTSIIISIVIGLCIAVLIGIYMGRNIQTIIKKVVSQTKMLADAAIQGKLDTRANPEETNFEFREIIIGVNSTLDALIAPLNVAAEYVDRISKGDIPPKITDDYKGDFNELKNNLNQCIVAVKLLVEDAKTLSKSAAEGKLDSRADVSKHQGDFREVIQGVNETLDNVIRPLNVAAEYVERIAKGEIPAKITDSYNGDFNEIKNNLNLCIDGLGGLVEASDVLGKMAYNDYSSRVEGNYQGIFLQTGTSVNLVQERISHVVKMINNISKGDLGDIMDLKKVGKRSENDILVPAFIKMIEAIQLLVNDASMLAKAAQEGKLSTRADASKHSGDFKAIVDGVNNTLDAVIVPLNVAAEYVDNISKGNIPEKITDSYNGDFNEIKNNLNRCIGAVNLLITDAKTLASAAIDGKLATRADASKHSGDFKAIVDGVNNTLDAVIGPLNVAADYVERISKGDMPQVITDNYNGDFNIIKNNLNILISALNEVVEKAKLVAGGDLTVALKKRSDNDELMQSLTEMVKSTARIISEFKAASESISTSSQQMSSTSQQMSQGATEQASSAEEVSSSMEEMAANIQQNTDNAQQTEKISLNAAEGINKVNEASGETLRYMQEIAEKVSIIGEIARQTNILALNAAVEAARAGEHGKGFAVVAAEVRKLAERSQISAVEIDNLTKNSVRATDESAKLLASIAPEIGKTAKLVQEIAAASIEQNSGADQVNNAIQQLNQVTQQNAAASEELATSSLELADQAEGLLEMISFFKVKEAENKLKEAVYTEGKTRVQHEIKSPVSTRSKQNVVNVRKLPKSKSNGFSIDMSKDNHDSNYEKF
jgi:methyl-accepting chemotaxis protein